MVRPISSKRKLFSISKEQKENEPADLQNQREAFITRSNGALSKLSCKKELSQDNISVGSYQDNIVRDNCNLNLLRKNESNNDGALSTPSRQAIPMSERQQIALLKQLSSPDIGLIPTSPLTPNAPSLSRGLKRNERGETPLHVAAIKGDALKISQLIEDGADVNVPDYAGWLPLHEACNRGFASVASLLIEAGSDVNAKGLDNVTPLHDACVNNHYKIVNLLLRFGASVHCKNRSGKTPREVCTSKAVLALLKQGEANKCDICDLGFQRKLNYSPNFTSWRKEMSRRTPPTSKVEEKPAVSSSAGVTSGCGTTGNNAVSTASPASSTSGPGSPRLTLRLPQVPRTPDKPLQRSGGDGEDPYEFRCSKDESKEDKDDEKTDVAKEENKAGEKRARDDEDEEEAKRKKKKEEMKDVLKGVGRGGIVRPVVADKGIKSVARIPQNLHQISGKSLSPASVSSTTGAMPTSPPVSSAASQCQILSQAVDTSVNSSLPSSPHPPSTKEDGEDSPTLPKVPPLKIVLAPSKDTSEQETNTQLGKQNPGRQLPYVVNSNNDGKEEGTDSSKEIVNTVKEEIVVTSGCVSISHSSITMTGTMTSCSTLAVPSTTNGNTSSSSLDKGSTTRLTRSQRGGGGSSNEDQPATIKSEVKSEEPPSTQIEVVHPRKRKIKIKVESEVEQPQPQPPEQTISNCYEMFLKIRQQVERRRKLLFPVQPKPPQGFKDYLMNRCSYALQGNSNIQLTVPTIAVPASLAQSLKDLFTEQEKERYKLRLQHQIEREKLVLSVEQEILRVHGRAARALANQVLPFSVCTILKDEEVYNLFTPEQEEKDRNARSRYNGRLFLSWLQDVDDKWEKIKENMVLRHHNESESLHAVQKMDWEWKLKENGLAEPNTRPVIEEFNVPMVQVSDFDLLPA